MDHDYPRDKVQESIEAEIWKRSLVVQSSSPAVIPELDSIYNPVARDIHPPQVPSQSSREQLQKINTVLLKKAEEKAAKSATKEKSKKKKKKKKSRSHSSSDNNFQVSDWESPKAGQRSFFTPKNPTKNSHPKTTKQDKQGSSGKELFKKKSPKKSKSSKNNSPKNESDLEFQEFCEKIRLNSERIEKREDARETLENLKNLRISKASSSSDNSQFEIPEDTPKNNNPPPTGVPYLQQRFMSNRQLEIEEQDYLDSDEFYYGGNA